MLSYIKENHGKLLKQVENHWKAVKTDQIVYSHRKPTTMIENSVNYVKTMENPGKSSNIKESPINGTQTLLKQVKSDQ